MSRAFDPSAFATIGAEDLDTIAAIKASLVDHYQPANSEELFVIERIALARHSLLRTYRIESGLVTFGLQTVLQIPGSPAILTDPELNRGRPATGPQNGSFWMAAAFCEVNRKTHWQFFLRYQAQAERLYRRALEEFEQLRAHRGISPEPASVNPEPEPAAQQPTASHPSTPKRRRAASPAAKPRQPIAPCHRIATRPTGNRAIRYGRSNAP